MLSRLPSSSVRHRASASVAWMEAPSRWRSGRALHRVRRRARHRGVDWVAGHALLATDPWASSTGDFFVKLAGTPTTALVIDYDYPTAAAGLLLDVDADETWVIRAYSDSGITLVAETILAGGWRARVIRPPHRGPSRGRRRTLCNCGSCRRTATSTPGRHSTGSFPRHVLFRGQRPRVELVSGPSPSVGLQLSATPGIASGWRQLVRSTPAVGPWTRH